MIQDPTFVNAEGLITNLSITAPIKTISEANNYDGWRAKAQRKKAQYNETWYEIHNALKGRKIQFPCVVKLTRIGPKMLDVDNLANSFKSCQDAIAAKIGVDDGDTTKVNWIYSQEPCDVRKYSIRIEIHAK